MSNRNTTTRPWKAILSAAAIGLSFFIAYQVLSGNTPTTLTSTPDKTVRYVVSARDYGAANNVTYSVGNGTQQETQVVLPWEKTFTTGGAFQPLVVTAQNPGSGWITCQILVDGTVVSEHTSTGQYAVVVCSGTTR